LLLLLLLLLPFEAGEVSHPLAVSSVSQSDLSRESSPELFVVIAGGPYVKRAKKLTALKLFRLFSQICNGRKRREKCSFLLMCLINWLQL